MLFFLFFLKITTFWRETISIAYQTAPNQKTTPSLSRTIYMPIERTPHIKKTKFNAWEAGYHAGRSMMLTLHANAGRDAFARTNLEKKKERKGKERKEEKKKKRIFSAAQCFAANGRSCLVALDRSYP